MLVRAGGDGLLFDLVKKPRFMFAVQVPRAVVVRSCKRQQLKMMDG
jgi:hypothetical protein